MNVDRRELSLQRPFTPQEAGVIKAGLDRLLMLPDDDLDGVDLTAFVETVGILRLRLERQTLDQEVINDRMNPVSRLITTPAKWLYDLRTTGQREFEATKTLGLGFSVPSEYGWRVALAPASPELEYIESRGKNANYTLPVNDCRANHYIKFFKNKGWQYSGIYVKPYKKLDNIWVPKIFVSLGDGVFEVEELVVPNHDPLLVFEDVNSHESQYTRLSLTRNHKYCEVSILEQVSKTTQEV